MLKSILKASNAGYDAMISTLISEAPTLGPQLAEVVRLLTEFGERHQRRLETLEAAYKGYFEQDED